MNKKILNYIEKCESWKVAIKNLHWSADNMSQHELCDDIASEISDFEDLVSEVEQSITGKIKLNGFTPKSYEIKSLKSFVEDVISDSQSFLKELDKMGDKYIGIKSECESFIGVMQRKLYLVNFTMKEDLKRRLTNRINETWKREENIKTTFHGTKPSTERGLFKRINDLTKNGQLNTRVFNGVDDAFEFYNKILGNMGSLQTIEPNDSIHIVKLDTNGGMSYYGLMRTKDEGDGRCKASITFSPHSEEMEEVDPEMSEPTIEDGNDYEEPFDRIGDTSRYDMEGARIAQERLKKEYPDWFTRGIAVENKVYEIYREGRVTRMSGNELRSLIKESVKRVLKESSDDLRELAQRLAEVGGGSLTDEERELLRNAGYTFNTISGPGYRVTDILLNGRRVAKTINGKTKWY